jgi:hypothetical protein
MLIDHQDAPPVRNGARIVEQESESALVGLARIPPGFRKEPLQALRFLTLRSGHGLGVGKGGQSLVALGRKQQPFEVAAQAFTLGASAEEIVETGGVIFEWSGGRVNGQASGHGGISSFLPPLEHSFLPTSTNYR